MLVGTNRGRSIYRAPAETTAPGRWKSRGGGEAGERRSHNPAGAAGAPPQPRTTSMGGDTRPRGDRASSAARRHPSHHRRSAGMRPGVGAAGAAPGRPHARNRAVVPEQPAADVRSAADGNPVVAGAANPERANPRRPSRPPPSRSGRRKGVPRPPRPRTQRRQGRSQHGHAARHAAGSPRGAATAARCQSVVIGRTRPPAGTADGSVRAARPVPGIRPVYSQPRPGSRRARRVSLNPGSSRAVAGSSAHDEGRRPTAVETHRRARASASGTVRGLGDGRGGTVASRRAPRAGEERRRRTRRVRRVEPQAVHVSRVQWSAFPRMRRPRRAVTKYGAAPGVAASW